MAEFLFQNPVKMRELESLFVKKERRNNSLLNIVDVETRDIELFAYRIKDDFGGMQKARGFDSPTTPIEFGGHSDTFYYPTAYGEHYQFTESEKLMMYESQGAINRRTQEVYAKMLERQTRRMMYNAITSMRGVLQVADGANSSVTIFRQMFNPYTATIPTPITTYATSAPLAFLRATKLAANPNIDLRDGMLFMNEITLDHLLQNSNPNDLGKYANQLTPSMNMDRLSNILTTDLRLPAITVVDNREIFNGDRLGDTRTITKWIPDGQALLLGRIPGEPMVKYVKTAALNNQGNRIVGDWYNSFKTDRAPFVTGFELGHNGAVEMPYGAVHCHVLTLF